MRLLNMKKTKLRIVARTQEIKVGETYFLSSFHDVDGAFVKVLSKSTKPNSAGWPSSVEIEILEPFGEANKSFYAKGKQRTVNATNLYEHREDASPSRKRVVNV
jgi:hypothetical protein